MLCLVAQSCLTLQNPMNCSPPGSSVHGIFRPEYWSGLSCFSPGDLPNLGIEPESPGSPALEVDSLPGDLPDPRIEPESPGSPTLVGGFFTRRSSRPKD